MLTVPYFRQDTGFSCGPVSVQMLLAYFHVRDSEQKLIHETHARPQGGTENHWIADALRAHGLTTAVRENASIDDLRDAITARKPAIVNYINPENGLGHFAVVVGVDADRVILNDPRNGAGFELPREEFLAAWHSGDGRHTRWMCTASVEH